MGRVVCTCRVIICISSENERAVVKQSPCFLFSYIHIHIHTSCLRLRSSGDRNKYSFQLSVIMKWAESPVGGLGGGMVVFDTADPSLRPTTVRRLYMDLTIVGSLRVSTYIHGNIMSITRRLLKLPRDRCASVTVENFSLFFSPPPSTLYSTRLSHYRVPTTRLINSY